MKVVYCDEGFWVDTDRLEEIDGEMVAPEICEDDINDEIERLQSSLKDSQGESERLRAEIERLHGLVASARNWIDPDEHQDWEEQASIEASSCQGTIERLTADRDQFERESCERFQQLDAALKRIESLEQALAKASLRTQELEQDRERGLEERGYHIITTDQIDAAWEYVQNILFATKGNADFKRFAKEIFERIGIVACEECGGSGVVREHERGYEDGVEDTCPSCHGHGWKEVSDECD